MGAFDAVRAVVDTLMLQRSMSDSLGSTPQMLIPPRSPDSVSGSVVVDRESAQRASAVWASVRVRADVVSTLPLPIKRKRADGSIEILDDPRYRIDTIGGPLDFESWMYASQSDLDTVGNAIGIIRDRDPVTLRPTWVELQDAKKVTIRSKGGVITYKIAGTVYDASDIWHERQFAISGSVVGLSPLHYAEWIIGQNLSALKFGNSYFESPGLPTAILRNVKKALHPDEARIVRERFEKTQRDRGIWVTGSDWELNLQTISADEAQFLATLQSSALDIARFFGVPGDVIDLSQPGGSITYQNVTQKFLSFLVLHMQPALVRRERKFTRDLLPNKIYAEFDPSKLVRMDPVQQAAVQGAHVAARIRPPSEIREQDLGLPPLTPEQIQEFEDLGITAVPAAPAVPKDPAKPKD